MGACLGKPMTSRNRDYQTPAASGAAAAAATSTHVDDDKYVEHISDREDHVEHEIAILHSLLPTSRVSPSGHRTPQRPEDVAKRRLSNSHLLVESDSSLAHSKKFNSTATLFVDSTVSQPSLEETLRCVGVALRYIVEDGHKQEEPLLYPEHFDESEHPLTDLKVPRDYNVRIPTEDEIYYFMNKLFHATALSAECGIISLVYINRLLIYTGMALHASNWKRVLLGAILMASKVWDDQAVWNVDFCTILPKITVEDMNELERVILEMLNFNINVDSSVYAKYYFELRALAEKTHKAFPLQPLSTEQAEKLEAHSDAAHRSAKKTNLRMAKSLDSKEFTSLAIIS